MSGAQGATRWTPTSRLAEGDNALHDAFPSAEQGAGLRLDGLELQTAALDDAAHDAAGRLRTLINLRATGGRRFTGRMQGDQIRSHLDGRRATFPGQLLSRALVFLHRARRFYLPGAYHTRSQPGTAQRR